MCLTQTLRLEVNTNLHMVTSLNASYTTVLLQWKTSPTCQIQTHQHGFENTH